MSDSDPQTPNVEGQANRSTDSTTGNTEYHNRPSSDFLASVHSVEVDRDDHREQRSLNFYRPDSDRRVRPGDDLDGSMCVRIPRSEMKKRGADPNQVFTANIRPDANLDAPAGSTGVFEKIGNGRVRFVGTLDDLNGVRVSTED